MANSQNLKRSSPKEARENGRKGGIASAQARQRKRAICESLQRVLSGKYEIEGKRLDGYDGLAVSMVEQALKGNVSAFIAIRDTIGEKPKEKAEVDATVKVVMDKSVERYSK